MRKILTEKETQKIRDAKASVAGTKDYMKYEMMAEHKTKKDGKWSPWKYLCHGVPYTKEVEVKTVGNNVYLIENNNDSMTRYLLTDEVKNILEM